MGTDFVVTLILSILSSSAISALLNTYVFEPKRDRQKYILGDKKIMYDNIIFFGQMVLYPEEARYAINVNGINLEHCSTDKIIELGIIKFKMAIPKILLLTTNENVVKEANKFIDSKNEDSFGELIKILQKDLYN